MGFVQALFGVLLFLTALFLILLVMIQRGKGGGLSGAFGGMGGQSAFGTKAGDLFTKITIGVAVFWIILCILSVKCIGVGSNPLTGQMKKVAPAAPLVPGAQGESLTKPAAPAQGAAPSGTTPAPSRTAPAPSAPAPAAPAAPSGPPAPAKPVG